MASTKQSWDDLSRSKWTSTGVSIESIPNQVKIGSLQRIAAACEKISDGLNSVIRERDQYKRWYEQERKSHVLLQKQISTLRGQVTKLKRRVAK
jgi:hypothetical protein